MNQDDYDQLHEMRAAFFDVRSTEPLWKPEQEMQYLGIGARIATRVALMDFFGNNPGHDEYFTRFEMMELLGMAMRIVEAAPETNLVRDYNPDTDTIVEPDPWDGFQGG